MSHINAVDGSPKFQLKLGPLKKEESDETDQDGWVRFSEVSFAFSRKTKIDRQFPAYIGANNGWPTSPFG